MDAGCSFRALNNSLGLIDTAMSGIEAVFITHEHVDHIKGLEQIIKHTDVPIFATSATADALRENGKIPAGAAIYDARGGYRSASFEVSCFKTSHDAADSVGYKIRYGGECYGVCTDTGYVTEDAAAALKGCLAVLLESNYDEDMLRRNPNYPPLLKARILGERGHLSNVLCAEFAEKLIRGGARHLILGHLSRENNTPATAKGAAKRYLAERGLAEERDFTLNVAPVQTAGEYIAV